MIPRTLADEAAGAGTETSNDTVDCICVPASRGASQRTHRLRSAGDCAVWEKLQMLLTLRAGPVSAVHKAEQHGVNLVSPVPFPKPRTTSHLSNSLKVALVRGCEESTIIRTQA